MWANMQNMAVVHRHLLALGVVLPGKSLKVCSEGKVAMQVLFEEGTKRASSSRLVATNLFYLCLVYDLGLGNNGIYSLGIAF